MSIREAITNGIVRGILRILFRYNPSELRQVPSHGPMLMVTNHTSVFEGPFLYVYLRPRRTIALAKRQLWKNWFTRMMMETWQTIPVDRGMMDRKAMDACFQVLKDGDFLCLAPEGTRSKDGALKKGKAGTAFFALREEVPVIPVVTIGFEQFPQNIKRLRRTPITIKVGTPFEVIRPQGRVTNELRQAITDEMMIRLSQLMPENLRGYYSSHDGTFLYTRKIETS